MSLDLFTCPRDVITIDDVDVFVRTMIADRLQAESLVLEFKSDSNKENIPKAVAAMSNTEGGIIIVGVDENDLEDPVVGVERSRHDSIVSALRAKVPDAMPEIIPVALRSGERLALVIRVDSEAVDHPIVVDGTVYVRIPGQSIGARRDEILALCSRSSGLTVESLASAGSYLPGLQLWSNDSDAGVEVRGRARFVLPHRLASRSFIGSDAIEGVLQGLADSPIPGDVIAEHVGMRERRRVSWAASRTGSLVAEYTSEPSAFGSGWRRPKIEGRAQLYLDKRVLHVTVAARLEPQAVDDERPHLSVEDLYDVLVAACWTCQAVGGASLTAMGADFRPNAHVLDAAVSKYFGHMQLSLGLHRSKPSSGQAQQAWTFPAEALVDRSLEAVESLVRQWLHVPLFEAGLLGFEKELSQLRPGRWAEDIHPSH